LAIQDVREIMAVLPHRYPLLLVDRVLELEPMKFARGYKNVTANEPVMTGHFPGNPVLPGVYIIEAMAQLGGMTIMRPGEMSRKVPYLAGIEKAKFRRPVVPGDQLMMEARVLRTKLNVGWVAVQATVDGQLAAAAEITFSVQSDAALFTRDASVLHL
jgi:beta-hydroxyacyl-ACP dehydratase FabZ